MERTAVYTSQYLSSRQKLWPAPIVNAQIPNELLADQIWSKFASAGVRVSNSSLLLRHNSSIILARILAHLYNQIIWLAG